MSEKRTIIEPLSPKELKEALPFDMDLKEIEDTYSEVDKVISKLPLRKEKTMSNDNDKVKGQARKEVEEALEKVAHPQAKGFWIDWKRILTPIISKALETHLRRIEELEKDKSEQVTTQMHERGKLIKRITEFEEVLEQCKRWHDGDKWRFDKNPERRKDWERQRDFINQALSPKQGECDE